MNTDQKLIKKGLKMACFDSFQAFIGVNRCSSVADLPFSFEESQPVTQGEPAPVCAICVICGSTFSCLDDAATGPLLSPQGGGHMMGASEVLPAVVPAFHPGFRVAPGRRGGGVDAGRGRGGSPRVLLRHGRRWRGHLSLSQARAQPDPAAGQLPAARWRCRAPGPAPGRAGPAAGGSRTRAHGLGHHAAPPAEPAGAGVLLPWPRPRPGPTPGPVEVDPDLRAALA